MILKMGIMAGSMSGISGSGINPLLQVSSVQMNVQRTMMYSQMVPKK